MDANRFGLVLAEVVEIPRGDTKISDTLFSAAQLRECGLMVMGAYGGSVMVEKIFGGVTESVFSTCTTPVLFAH